MGDVFMRNTKNGIRKYRTSIMRCNASAIVAQMQYIILKPADLLPMAWKINVAAKIYTGTMAYGASP